MPEQVLVHGKRRFRAGMIAACCELQSSVEADRVPPQVHHGIDSAVQVVVVSVAVKDQGFAGERNLAAGVTQLEEAADRGHSWLMHAPAACPKRLQR